MIQKQVLITGGKGFLGSWVDKELRKRNLFNEIISVDKDDFDLTDESDVKLLFKRYNPAVVIHCAGILGGIEFMSEYPGEIFYKNIKMNILLMEYARLSNVKKYIQIGSSSEYPETANSPFKESCFWNGVPEMMIRPYAMAKKIHVIQQEAYFRQYGFNSVHLLLSNLYGPGDHFSKDRSHVISSMIRKISSAKESGKKEVTFWGNGNQKREFLFIQDAAVAVIKALEYNSIQPVNIGSDEEVTIKELSKMIKNIIGYKGVILWDTEKSSGQKRRKLNTITSINSIGFKTNVSLIDGLKKTIAWYNQIKGTVDE